MRFDSGDTENWRQPPVSRQRRREEDLGYSAVVMVVTDRQTEYGAVVMVTDRQT